MAEMIERVTSENTQGVGDSQGTTKPSKARSGAPKGNKNARKHGVSTARGLLKQWGTLALDGRLPLVKERNAWLKQVLTDMGGRNQVGEMKLSLLESLADDRLIVKSFGLHLLTSKIGLMDRKTRTAHPCVMQYFTMIDSWQRRCVQLGLERKAAEVPDLQDYLALKATPTPATKEKEPI